MLGVVALLINGTLPAGEIQEVGAQEIIYGFKTIEFTENAKFNIEISPFSSGVNTILVKVSDFNNKPLYDSDKIKVKISNPSKNISPIEIQMVNNFQGENNPVEFQGELTFGFSGEWQIEIEAQRTENANESKIIKLLVKPRLANIQTQIIEYELPEDAKPLFPLYDGKDSIWISDPSAPRIWQFSLDNQKFSPYSFDGDTTTFLTYDNKGKIWFSDPPRNQIGFIDIETKNISTITIPKMDPLILENTPFAIQADFDGNIWISILNKDKIIKYLPELETFEEIVLPGKETFPFTLTVDSKGKISFPGDTTTFLTYDNKGKIWFSDPPRNQIGFIDIETKNISTITIPKMDPLILENTPFAIQADFDGNIWISILNKDKIIKYLPELETFEEIVLPGKETFPFTLTVDSKGKIWFGTTGNGKIGNIDPKDNTVTQILTETILQGPEALFFDDKGNLWIAEHTGSAIIKFNPILETFERISVPGDNVLPFGMTVDRYGNIWFAQHTVDDIGAYDPDNNNLIQIPIPTNSTFVQFMTSDGDGNIWFVEQQANKIGTVKITEIPLIASQIQTTNNFELKYTEIASPLIALGIIATSLFFVKSIQDKRRLNSMINS